MLETPDPLSLEAMRAADKLEHELARIPQVEAHSLLDLYRRGAARRRKSVLRKPRGCAHSPPEHRCSAAPDCWATTISALRSSWA